MRCRTSLGIAGVCSRPRLEGLLVCFKKALLPYPAFKRGIGISNVTSVTVRLYQQLSHPVMEQPSSPGYASSDRMVVVLGAVEAVYVPPASRPFPGLPRHREAHGSSRLALTRAVATVLERTIRPGSATRSAQIRFVIAPFSKHGRLHRLDAEDEVSWCI